MNYLTKLAKLMKIQKVMAVIDKGTSQDWSDAEIMGQINNRDTLFNKFKNSRLHFGKDNY